MKTKIFSHNGIIGAETDIENGKFINDVRGQGQMGCVISTDECVITTEAREILRGAPREGGSFAPIMLTKHEGAPAEHGDASIGLFGFGKHIFAEGDICIGRTCSKEILDLIEVDDEMEIPEDFKKAVEA